MPELLYKINPDRNEPWNELPLLPIHEKLYRTIEILEQLGKSKAAISLKSKTILATLKVEKCL